MDQVQVKAHDVNSEVTEKLWLQPQQQEIEKELEGFQWSREEREGIDSGPAEAL